MNILFLVHRVPHPPDKGDRIRSFHLLKHLSKLGRVHLATFADEPVSPASIRLLESLTERIAVFPVGGGRWLKAAFSLATGKSATEGLFSDSRMVETIRQWTFDAKFEAAIAFCSSMARYIERLPIARKFVDLVDVDSEKFAQYSSTASFPKKTLYAMESKRLRSLETRIGGFTDCVALATDPEAALYRSIAPDAQAAAVHNGVDLDYFRRTSEISELDSCLFVGAMDYRANVEGVIWFADEVWPEVLRRRPNAKFRIVGRRPTTAIQSLARRDGIEVVADTPDVRPYLDRSALSVAPLRVARGVQNKVLEAMAVGRPVLASPEASIGLNVEDGRELLLAGQPDQWIERLCLLWDDAELRRRLSDAGRRYVEVHHSWDACLSPWTEWLASGVEETTRKCESSTVRARS